MRHSWRVILAGAVVAFGQTVRAAEPAPPSVDDIIGSLTPSAVEQKCAPGAPCRGIRAGNAPVAAIHAAPVSAPASVSGEKGSGTLDMTLEFPSGSSLLTAASRTRLSRLGQAMVSPQLAAYRFRIEGHTDTVGSPEQNQALSEARAKSVVDYLTATFHIDAARLEAVGMGEQGLAVPTPPQTPEARNRRVHIVNLGS